MGDRIRSFFRAGEFHIPGESVLAAAVCLPADQALILIISSHIGEKHGRMALPVGGIRVPENLTVLFLIVDL